VILLEINSVKPDSRTYRDCACLTEHKMHTIYITSIPFGIKSYYNGRL